MAILNSPAKVHDRLLAFQTENQDDPVAAFTKLGHI
jgi:hypothetical protein